MPHAEYPDIDPDWGHWFAGFVDGEGNFSISRPRNGGLICSFTLALRDDDEPVLRDARERLGGIGAFYRRPAGSAGPNSNPQITWGVCGKSPAYHLVTVFDRFPLRAKKARDFAIWREAVVEWNRIGPGRGQHHKMPDWSGMVEMKRRLEATRAYRPSADSLLEPVPKPTVVPIPTLFDAA